MRLMAVGGGIIPISLGLISSGLASVASTCFEPPTPEPIEVVQLPLPPVAPTDEIGACTHHLNPHGTGCMGKSSLMNGGDFSPDGNHVLVSLNFTGAPSAPDPASIYTGVQLILVSTNGTSFSTGSPWKCLTCGVPESNKGSSSSLADYPQAFSDGKRALAGNNIVECRSGLLASDACTPDQIHIYPIRLSNTADDSGSGAIIRELRLHPDNVHLGFNSFSVTGSGQLSQHAYFGRLQFSDSPATDSPRPARYDLVNVTVLVAPNGPLPYTVAGDQLQINRQALVVGEFRGFASRGQEVLYIGFPWESCNIDLFAADLTTGRVRRVTTHPGYVDPVGVSPDGRWQVILDTRGTDRMEFLSAMRGVPPVVDLLTVTTVASVRNNGDRRFFQPWLLDAQGDRDGPDYHYYGQQINAGGDGQPGSINDPNWNAGADPRCRQPYHLDPVEPFTDRVPWGLPYTPGQNVPEVFNLSPGNYTLHGQVSGSADVILRNTTTASALDFVAVTYHNYSDDGVHYIQGHESVASTFLSVTSARLDWYSNLTATGAGATSSTKVTGPGGFHVVDDAMLNVFVANGTLATTVDGVVYKQPLTGT
ncbi:uncharacterized protein BO95DRAFT_489336 [Aspergillus brunneoviolaceus CBS 621.78]|uniref:Uncharacterized protein n=1 Tax=Aspergillus brunneoviolaceus CBS 621.78 TaxID=1450534 RepID=A0ACD1GI17_9EURO|nr:hypothetical protein BO95DRAFT_489336 [Aspergillus brunneoviolaceus CBS 621.78]RAH48891.1 hypothetical protein BO95DRAFT_489336 [Aspergillus brunneoviolaceus CBS 621.78]